MKKGTFTPNFSLEKFALAMNPIHFVKGFIAGPEPEAVLIISQIS